MDIALIDADSIYFRAAYANTKPYEIRSMIDYTMKEIEGACFMPATMRVAVKGRGNFRKDLYPKYKANRPELKPEIKKALNIGHKYMIEKYDAVMADNMEADDLVCIWAHEAREMEMQYVIVGIDKDLKQIPGNHYNFGKKVHDFVDDDTAHYNLMLQCLTGDGSDNIPGIKGIGPKKGEVLLRGVACRSMWSRVRRAWREHGAGDPKLSRRLLEMLTSWEEFNDITSYLSDQTTECKQDVRKEGEDHVQDEGLPELSGGDEGRDTGRDMALRNGAGDLPSDSGGVEQGIGPRQPDQTTP